MNNPGDRVIIDRLGQGTAILDTSLHKRHVLGHAMSQPMGKIVDDDRTHASVLQGEDDVCSDVSGSTRDQPGAHEKTSPVRRSYASTYFARVCSTM